MLNILRRDLGIRSRRYVGTKAMYILCWKGLVVPKTRKASMLGLTPERYPVTVDMARFSERSGSVSLRFSRMVFRLLGRGARFVHAKTLEGDVSGWWMGGGVAIGKG